ncbi:lytic polysaccharide monooxygenase [Neolentinus lepideus HHB14362 ss-1]|uniref:lytic cellulose monooxygenase (C4-dehydrogenating) n=1 Tax=Neolentinus lepideus HHB14362 ss-1 TaxID=1314782 RepID=A0A165VQI6_9AGAM|nr:lytic polysaccharide monooxygenase [Neolentinus lepideus HHB14362 ss-1]
MLLSTKAFLAVVACALGVQAHGYVDTLNVGGTTYTGYLPFNDPYTTPTPQRIERAIPNNGPVTDVTLLDIQCNGSGGSGSSPAPLVASIAAGGKIAFHWTAWPSSHVGPVITYLGKVPSGTDITSYEPTGSNVIWFKIDQAGYSNGEWAATDVLSAQNSTWTVTVPSKLAPGQYIVRHEIIALHQAESYPGAQFYPDCFQIQVTGSGTQTPASSYLVSFPGGYTSTTPGVVFDVYSSFTSYPIPGPAVWNGN